MKFSIKRNDLIKALQKIQGVVEKSQTMPILANVLLETREGMLDVMASDMEMFVKDSVAADITEHGAITVNARKFFEITRELNGETINVSLGENQKVSVKAGKARFNINGLLKNEFPMFPSNDGLKFDQIECSVLRDMIDKTIFAVSTDTHRHIINGILLEKEGQHIRLAGTDGHRLAVIERMTEASGENISVVIPKKGLTEVRHILDDDDGSILFSINPKTAVFMKGNTVVNLRLLEGEFPAYRKVIPNDHDKTAVLGRKDFVSALKRVSVMSSDKVKSSRLKFSNGVLELQMSSPDLGTATEEISAEFGEGELEIGFNATYLIDVMDALEDEKVKITLKSHLDPIMIKRVDSEDYLHIVMPIRL